MKTSKKELIKLKASKDFLELFAEKTNHTDEEVDGLLVGLFKGGLV